MLGAIAACLLFQEAQAILGFKKQFEKLYINEKTNKDYAKTIKSNKTGCFVCHQGKKSKKNLNPYGVHLGKLLDKKKDAKEKEKIVAAIKKVEKYRSNPKDKKSPTYGELIKKNKLPGGPLKEVQKEPKKDDKKKGEDGKEETEKEETKKPEKKSEPKKSDDKKEDSKEKKED